MPLSQSQKDIITASIPFLEEHGVDLTAKFYAYMLDNHPEVRPFFNKSHQATKAQPKVLAFALVNYAKNINDLTPLLGFVRQIVEKHVGLQVQPEQYDVVGACLLHTLAELLGEAATPEFMEAWKVAYYDLANILISLERDRYAEVIRTEKAWAGFKPAKVSKKVSESRDIVSIYFDAEDGHYATPFPGQYICVRMSTDGGETIQSREYSISNGLEEDYKHYRVSVKRLPGGVMSNFIHDKLSVGDGVEISAPYGKLLEPALKSVQTGAHEHEKPVVFFIGGIGITPSLSLVEYFLRRGNQVKVLLSFASTEARVFGDEYKALEQKYDNLGLQEFVTHATEESPNLHKRRINAGDIEFVTNDWQIFLVGPLGYMDTVNAALAKRGVDLTKVNSEQFGPVHV